VRFHFQGNTRLGWFAIDFAAFYAPDHIRGEAARRKANQL
jgi:hypothetical protein